MGDHLLYSLIIEHCLILFTQKDISPLMANWMETILTYSFKIVHRPGILNILPDTLSRLFTPSSSTSSASLHHVKSFGKETDWLPKEQRLAAIELAHLQGHFGVAATLTNPIQNGQKWPNMRQDVEDFIKRCLPCQRFSITRQGFHPLKPITAARPMPSHCHRHCAFFSCLKDWKEYIVGRRLRPYPFRAAESAAR